MLNVVKIVNDVIVAESLKRDEGHGPRESHWPTSGSVKVGIAPKEIVYGECILKTYRKWMKVPETNPFSLVTLKKIGWGIMVHDWVTSKLEKAVLSETSQLKCLESKVKFKMLVQGLRYQVSGEIDNILNKTIGLEVKSSFGKFFFGKEGLLVVGPKREHIIQSFCYLKARPDIEEFILYYVARDTGFELPYSVRRCGDFVSCYYWDMKLRKERTFLYPEITWEGILYRWGIIESCLKEGVIPFADFKFRSQWPCSGCCYYDLCYPDHPKRKELPMYDIGEVVT